MGRTASCLAVLASAALVGSACAPAARCGEGPACDDDERCDAGACVASEASGAVRIGSFTASPAQIAAGDVVTLAWTSRNAAACTLAPGLGAVPRSGQVEVRPAATTTWTLACEGPSGPATAEAAVQVAGGEVDDGGARDLDASVPDASSERDDGGPREGGVPDAGPLVPPVVVAGSVALLDAPPASLSAAVGAEGAILFRERAGVVVDEWLLTDAIFPASYGPGRDLPHTDPRAQLVPGHVLDSWLLHLENPTEVPIFGTLSFASEVVAVSWRAATLDDTDEHFAAPDTSYATGGAREWSLWRDDFFTLSDDRKTLTFEAPGTSPDQLRVLVEASGSERPLVKSWTLNVHREGPLDLRLDRYEPEDHGVLVDEGTHTLGADLSLDANSPGRFQQSGQLSGGAIAAGTAVRSWLLHFDPAPNDGGTTSFVGVARFERPILGIITSTAKLASSDGLLARDDVNYPTAYNYRGMEPPLGDEVWWSADGRSLRVELVPTAGGVGLDQIRVITLP